jgi:taurine dioxygenase
VRTTVLDPVGVEITDVALAGIDAAELQDLLARHGVAVLPGQDADDTAFVAFLRRFGELVFTTGETPVPGFPDLNVISNVGRTTPPRSTFHVDTSYVARPPAYTALRAVEVPRRGGQTLFTQQYRAFDTLPDDVRAALDGRTIRHVVTGVDPAALGPDDETEAEHPIFRPHPVSGRTALYLSTPARCAAVSGMDDAQAAETVAFLHAHSTRDDNVHRHSWSPGDVVMWDNGCVLHRADHSGVVGDRVMHRGMASGYGGTASGSYAGEP